MTITGSMPKKSSRLPRRKTTHWWSATYRTCRNTLIAVIPNSRNWMSGTILQKKTSVHATRPCRTFATMPQANWRAVCAPSMPCSTCAAICFWENMKRMSPSGNRQPASSLKRSIRTWWRTSMPVPSIRRDRKPKPVICLPRWATTTVWWRFTIKSVLMSPSSTNIKWTPIQKCFLSCCKTLSTMPKRPTMPRTLKQGV